MRKSTITFKLVGKYLDVTINEIIFQKKNITSAASSLINQKDLGHISEKECKNALLRLYKRYADKIYFGSYEEIKVHNLICFLKNINNEIQYQEDPETRPVFKKCYDTTAYQCIGHNFVSKYCYTKEELNEELDIIYYTKELMSETSYLSLCEEIPLIDFSKTIRKNHVKVTETELVLN